MKILTLLTSLLVFTAPSFADNQLPSLLTDHEVSEIVCGENQTIKGHMKVMSQLIDELRNLVNDVLDPQKMLIARPLVVEKTQKLRVHLSTVFNKSPEKLYEIDPTDVRRGKLIFQQYLVDVINKTIAIERELLNVPVDLGEMQDQRVEVAKLLIDVQKIVQEAHDKFRD